MVSLATPPNQHFTPDPDPPLGGILPLPAAPPEVFEVWHVRLDRLDGKPEVLDKLKTDVCDTFDRARLFAFGESISYRRPLPGANAVQVTDGRGDVVYRVPMHEAA